MKKSTKAKMLRESYGKRRVELDKLGRDNTNKRGRKCDKPEYSIEQQTALQVYGKFVRLDGWIVETLDHLDRRDDFIII